MAIGCGATPPAPPQVDPVQSPTALTTIDVTGTAKWGSTVRISGGAQDATGTADPYTARFRITVQLTPNTTNMLSVTATDGNGTSDPTVVNVASGNEPLFAHFTIPNNTPQMGNPTAYTLKVTDSFGNDVGLNGVSIVVTGPTPAPTCGPSGDCTTPVAQGTITFNNTGFYTVTTSFAGNNSYVSDTVYVSAVNDPTVPLVTIVSPTPTDVYAPGQTINVLIKSLTANSNGGTASFIASGIIRASGSAPIGQSVCQGSGTCTSVFPGINVNSGPAAFGPETIQVIVTDGATGATISKSVTFTIDPARNIQANGGRTVTVIARAGAFNRPMGLSAFGAAPDLYIANNGGNNVIKVTVPGMATMLPVIPQAGVSFTAGLNTPTDAQLRPLAGALTTYPPTNFQGLHLGGVGVFKVTDNAGTPSSFGAFNNIVNTSYQSTAGATRIFATQAGVARVQIIDPTNGADALGGLGGLNFGLNEPWGVAWYVSGNTRVISSNRTNNTLRICDLGNNPMAANTIASCTSNQGNLADPTVGATLDTSRTIAIGPTSGKVYVVSQRGNNHGVLMYDQSGLTCTAGNCQCAGGTCPESVIATGFDTPNGLTFDAAGNMYVTDEVMNLVVRISPAMGGLAF